MIPGTLPSTKLPGRAVSQIRVSLQKTTKREHIMATQISPLHVRRSILIMANPERVLPVVMLVYYGVGIFNSR